MGRCGMDNKLGIGIEIPEIMLPDKRVNMRKWAVIACDQFTSNRAYWDEVERIVGGNPSTLHIMLPEIYLDSPDKEERIRRAKSIMGTYIDEGILTLLPKGFVLVERTIGRAVRKGLMVMVDLEEYDQNPARKSLVRASEEILQNRVLPRIDIRMGAELEMPHILLLMDDPHFKVIDPLWRKRDTFAKLYDFDLMLQGGRVAGYLVDDKDAEAEAVRQLSLLKVSDGMRFCVGDGNHSLQTAKTVWEEAKHSLSPEEREDSPLRYALCELINLHDPALFLKPIHRVISGMNPSMCIQYVVDRLNSMSADARLVFSRRKPSTQMTDAPQVVFFTSKESSGRIEINSPTSAMLVEQLQPVLESFVKEYPVCMLDYIHGNEEFERITHNYDTLGFSMPGLQKETFFSELSEYGVFPKKCFSLGESNEKRYYIECRLLAKEEIMEEPEPLSADVQEPPMIVADNTSARTPQPLQDLRIESEEADKEEADKKEGPSL